MWQRRYSAILSPWLLGICAGVKVFANANLGEAWKKTSGLQHYPGFLSRSNSKQKFSGTRLAERQDDV